MSDGAGKYRRLMRSAIENVSRFFFDSFGRKNADFRARSGLKVTVIREEIGDCCSWCADLAGTYDYENVPKEAWQRHENCRCMVLTRTEKGTYQDAWSRKEYESERDARIAREETIIESANSERRKKPESDNNFMTLSISKGDTIRPANIRKELKKTEKGKEILEYIERENLVIQLLYGVDNEKDICGYYDPISDDIGIFCDKCKTIKETSITVIHEVTHRQNRDKGFSLFESEYEAYKAEIIHEHGKLTSEDERDIIKHIERFYGCKKG